MSQTPPAGASSRRPLRLPTRRDRLGSSSEQSLAQEPAIPHAQRNQLATHLLGNGPASAAEQNYRHGRLTLCGVLAQTVGPLSRT